MAGWTDCSQNVRELDVRERRYSMLSNQEMGSASSSPSFCALRSQQRGGHTDVVVVVDGDNGRKVSSSMDRFSGHHHSTFI